MKRNSMGQFIDGGFFGKHTEESKVKMSLAKKGKPSSWKGKHPSEESRLKMRLSHLGKKISQEQRKKMSEIMKGNTYGFKKGNSINKGVKKSPECLKKMSKENSPNWKGGNSAETRRKYAPRPKPEQCEICGAMGDICLDHSHDTNKFRGWICRRCNLALGMVKDNKEILEALIKYLVNNN